MFLAIAYNILGIFLGFSIFQVIQFIVDVLYSIKSRLEERSKVNTTESHTTNHVSCILFKNQIR